MKMPVTDWFNRKNSKDHECKCKASTEFWLEHSGQALPATCSVAGCNHPATIARQIAHETLKQDYVVPMCKSCYTRLDYFSLKPDTLFVQTQYEAAENT